MTAIDRLDAWLRISPSTVLPAEVLEYLVDVKAENETLRAERDEWHRVAQSKQDIIDHMRDANAENAQLRQQLDDVTESMGRVEERCAKLRELCKWAILCSEGDVRCEACPYHEDADSYVTCSMRAAAIDLDVELPA